MRVRNNVGALVAAGVVTAVLKVVTAGPGGPLQAATLDALVLHGGLGSVEYLAIFVGLHTLFRRRGLSGRWLYAAAGSLAALAMVATQTHAADWGDLTRSGMVSAYLALPTVWGAMLGFLYSWRAGLEPDGDDPARLAAALVGGPDLRDGSGHVSDDRALVTAGSEEYFDGPIQVRTSLPLALVAAVVASGAFGLARIAFGVSLDVVAALQHDASTALAAALGVTLGQQVFVLLLFGLIAPVPLAILILLGHAGLRAADRCSPMAYAGVGFLAPFILLPVVFALVVATPSAVGLAMSGVFLGYLLQAAIPMALACGLYRNMAGIEPRPVREDIRLNERRNLVGPDHVRRQFGRLVKG